MRLLERYVSKTILSASLVVLLIFFGLWFFVGVFGELGALGQGQYNIAQALKYVMFSMPLNIYQLYPSIALLGVLAGLGILASTNELTVIRASGISIMRIAWIVIKVALILILIMTAIGELAAPKMYDYAERRKAIAEHGSVIDNIQLGVWLHEGSSFIHIGTSLSSDHLQNITRFLFDKNNRLVSSSYSPRADYANNQWNFYDVHTTQFYSDYVVTKIIPKEPWSLSFKPHLQKSIDPNQMTLKRLVQQAAYSELNGLDASDYQLAFWERVLQPLATLVMVFLAIPFIFGPLRSSTMGLRVLSGVMVGLAFFILNRFFGPFSIVYQIPPLVAAAAPIILFFIIGLILMVYKR